MRFMMIYKPADTKDMEAAKRFPRIAGEGESEIRQMHDAPAFPPDSGRAPAKATKGATNVR